MEIGALVGIGRTADVFEYGGGRVLRRYRDGFDASWEVTVMTHLRRHGYPVPAVWAGGGAAELVLERLDGGTMMAGLLAGEVDGEWAGAVLGQLLERLHAVPAQESTDPAHRVLHLDLHPDNVFLTARGPVVIDWATAMDGPPGLDRAMSALILAQAALTMPEVGAVARATLRGLLRQLGGTEGMLLTQARARRADNPTMSATEIAALDGALALIAEVERELGR
ncbi:aminoglycoside phosphotransferase [Kitasatospora sp. MMS16-BH015]|uniref:phosphotransferase n=1 Tax=Kitasatospora sp. MMS16-BH015 TaxID=2018025 RepID=UPI000CA0CE75|nr:phosphotransferase [Kitasatospora sp. MMS16-BH015]AUG79262.1 aminoglycoside phosphotransferase [Kitasatospora sp. MMS16-BH015]